jgi:hypothetical protein
MTIEINTLLNNVVNKVYGAPKSNAVLSSVLYTTLLMSVSVLLIILLIYPTKPNSPVWLLVKTFLYVFMSNAIILILHRNMLKHTYEEKYDKGSDVLGGRMFESDKIKVSPKVEYVDAEEEIGQSSVSDDLEKAILDLK